MSREARTSHILATVPLAPRQLTAPRGGALGPPMPCGYVITLLSSTRPLDDVAARLPTANFGAAFCERRLVDGSAHYRLQLGPYRTMATAAQALNLARRIFPRAVIRAADAAPHAREHTAVPAQAPLAAQPVVSNASRHVPGPASTGARPVAKGTSGIATDDAIEIPDEHSPSKLYAVELLWSPDPLDLTHVPPLTLFDEKTLYAVSVHRANHPWYGLRVGFYRDGQEARRAAADLVGYFEGAIAVPATEQEFAQARTAEIRAWAARIDASVVVAA